MDSTAKKWQDHITHLEKLVKQDEQANPGCTSRFRQPLEQQRAALDHYLSQINPGKE